MIKLFDLLYDQLMALTYLDVIVAYFIASFSRAVFASLFKLYQTLLDEWFYYNASRRMLIGAKCAVMQTFQSKERARAYNRYLEAVFRTGKGRRE
ncbi:hypothetical protein [Vibrio porteresiae]|uniref:Uncharacterized protein n=1 Tax=Vibrio porteresiae DSM 19223 TaxID=1123496 RepID=A0ABZ0Q939_9VIBR|nr:hypothetical protein [Vibrio porteresiae]WPC72944.1 hypothetical protein R8Z52_12500 [Vibrio porteresiae DSM 19223]